LARDGLVMKFRRHFFAAKTLGCLKYSKIQWTSCAGTGNWAAYSSTG